MTFIQPTACQKLTSSQSRNSRLVLIFLHVVRRFHWSLIGLFFQYGDLFLIFRLWQFSWVTVPVFVCLQWLDFREGFPGWSRAIKVLFGLDYVIFPTLSTLPSYHWILQGELERLQPGTPPTPIRQTGFRFSLQAFCTSFLLFHLVRVTILGAAMINRLISSHSQTSTLHSFPIFESYNHLFR